ncbi:hypothetical protein UPYG_G00171520 [Umbra pygmaea]|uniref:Uncharacterized protein n=1 Tax=Umbra pygmaea TaxID=75934 RepID=A0ABD0WNS3_UMBPY
MWHAAKSLSKKLRQAGSMKNQTRIQVWRRDIVNHFLYCTKQAATEEPFKMMWPLEEGSKDKPWIIQGSAAHQTLTGIVLDKRWLTQMNKFINIRTTSDLEGFQNHLLMYAA